MYDETLLTLARQWVVKARNDLLCADNNLRSDQIPSDTVCFHCHQAVEKLLKAALVIIGISPPRTHVLPVLAELLSYKFPAIVQLADELAALTPYAIASRYPDDSGNLPDLEDACEARQFAENVLIWFKQYLPELVS